MGLNDALTSTGISAAEPVRHQGKPSIPDALAALPISHHRGRRQGKAALNANRLRTKVRMSSRVVVRMKKISMRQAIEKTRAGERNRTAVISLEGCCSTIELHPRRVKSTPNPKLARGPYSRMPKSTTTTRTTWVLSPLTSLVDKCLDRGTR
jgi:hypothetical protein